MRNTQTATNKDKVFTTNLPANVMIQRWEILELRVSVGDKLNGGRKMANTHDSHEKKVAVQQPKVNLNSSYAKTR